jgi:hypothetical protein
MKTHFLIRRASLFSLLILALCTEDAFSQNIPPNAVIWQERDDVSALNLIDGPGGTAHQPGNRFKFLKESDSGTSPKFEVEDENGVKWKVKLGVEARPETAATRLVWAAGYFVDEDYYRSEIHVDGLKRLSRGREFVRKDGTVVGARLERHRSGPEINWSWFMNSFAGSREFNGLRVIMALINNWDLKDINNSVYAHSEVAIYAVADLGASLGRTGNNFTRSKGVPRDYAHTNFIQQVRGPYVDFELHSRPFILTFLFNTKNYFFRTRMEKIVKNIPIDDARWVGQQLGRLSSTQIGDCFRSAGYSPADVEVYTQVVQQRIEALEKLRD